MPPVANFLVTQPENKAITIPPCVLQHAYSEYGEDRMPDGLTGTYGV